ncbi:hypothetical protein FGIG_09035 [Fasciola gigantica]|uniref:Uncharacterized protein n=1 Tax=Fasciola gigantica TaxID=46835 RepID=A0A504YFS3_FASGI|nr:hypothetical protein FGIG_09035 [Fasciola gigantica]
MPTSQSTPTPQQSSSTSSDLESVDDTDRPAKWNDEILDKSLINSQAQIDAAFSAHMRTILQPESSIVCPSGRLPTPRTSPDLTEGSLRYSGVRTPTHSPDRSGPSRLDVGVGLSISTSSWDEEQSSRERRLSDGEQPPVKSFLSSRPGPMNDPLLEVMALQGSKNFRVTSLTKHERSQIRRIASDLRAAQSQAQKVDWLMSLSGLGSHAHSRSVSSVDNSGMSRCSGHKNSKPKNDTNEITPNQLELDKVVRTDESDSSTASLSLGEKPVIDEEPKPTDLHKSPDLPKHSSSDTLEMFHAVESDASTTLNDPVYEDDYVTDSCA